MLKTAKRPTIQLHEHVMSPAGRIDRANGVIRGVKILGATSRNGRTYTPAAMLEAAKLYEGATVNTDHADRPGRSRSVRDYIGNLRDITVREDGVFGNLYLLSDHPYAGAVMQLAESNPKGFGLSHNATGRTSTRNGRVIVEGIESVRSVDLVQSPATVDSLFESIGQRPTRLREMDSLDYAGTSPDCDALAVDTLAQIRKIVDSSKLTDADMCNKIRALFAAAAPPSLAESLSDAGRVTYHNGESSVSGTRPRPAPQQPSATETARQAKFLREIGAKPAR